MRNIEFVSYNGGYPNLCSGQMVINVDGEEVVLNSPLISMGSAYCTPDEDIVTSGAWVLNLPDSTDEYYDQDVVPPVVFTEEEIKFIENLANENIPHGCCGGCL